MSNGAGDRPTARPGMGSVSDRDRQQDVGSVLRYVGHGGVLLGRGFEGRLDHILDPLGPHETQAVARALGDVVVVLAIARRKDDHRKACARGGNDFENDDDTNTFSSAAANRRTAAASASILSPKPW